jgi:cell division septal protein FtsQ
MFKKKRKLKSTNQQSKSSFKKKPVSVRRNGKRKLKTVEKKNFKFFKLKKIHIIIFAILLFLSGSIFSIKKFQSLKVKTVSCFVESINCSQAQILIPNLVGENFFKYDFNPLINKLKLNYPQIKQIITAKKFPCKFDIQITFRKPKAIIEDKFQNRFFIDEDTMVFNQTTNTKNNFIIIKTEEAINLGQKIVSQNIIYSLELVDYLESSLLPVKQIVIKNREDIQVDLQSGKSVFFTTEKDLQKQADSLIFILNNPQIDEKKKNTIDLRFENPIVK